MAGNSEVYSIILALVSAGAAGLIGSFALMKRLSLAGDVISHIALPGIGLAILYGINPVLGGAATLLLGTIIIWRVEEKTALTTEVAIGVIFASSLALGALITPKENLEEALFGGLGGLSLLEFVLGLSFAAIVFLAVWLLKNRLIIGTFSSDLAATTKTNLKLLNLFFLLIFSLTIILGLRFLGALLMGSLIIIPAAAARQIVHTLGKFLSLSSVFSVLSVAIGFALSKNYGLELGPAVVVVAASIFGLSLLRRRV